MTATLETVAAEPVALEPVASSEALTGWSTEKKTSEERKQILARSMATQLGRGNFRVETQSDFNAVLVEGKPVNHVLHLILSLVTLVWFIVWAVVASNGGEKRYMLQVDESGNVTTQKLS
jgi:hypothetical protein